MCSPQGGFVPKYGQKRNPSGRDLGCWQLKGRSCHSHKECGPRLFGGFVENSLKEWGLERE